MQLAIFDICMIFRINNLYIVKFPLCEPASQQATFGPAKSQITMCFQMRQVRQIGLELDPTMS